MTILPYIVSSPLHCGLHGLFHFLLSHQAARTWTYKCSFKPKNEEAHRHHVTGFKMNTVIFLSGGCVWFLQLMRFSNKNPKYYQRNTTGHSVTFCLSYNRTSTSITLPVKTPLPDSILHYMLQELPPSHLFLKAASYIKVVFQHNESSKFKFKVKAASEFF